MNCLVVNPISIILNFRAVRLGNAGDQIDRVDGSNAIRIDTITFVVY